MAGLSSFKTAKEPVKNIGSNFTLKNMRGVTVKRFLFLYPIREYIDREITDAPDDLFALERFNEIIDARYRQCGYQINWLLFSVESRPNIPDLSLIDPRIRIHAKDRIISAGLSRERHRKYIYPSCKKILVQLNPASELVLGGFHQTDCVDKIARAAHHNGLVVIVDEDTTDQFFKTARLQRIPPVMRTREEYAIDFRALLESMDNVFSHEMTARAIQEHYAERGQKPWLVQI